VPARISDTATAKDSIFDGTAIGEIIESIDDYWSLCVMTFPIDLR
jgi:hypothetical protein